MDHTMAKTKKPSVTKSKKYDDLDTVLGKIAKLKPTTKRQERAQTSTTSGIKRVRSYSMTSEAPDPYLAGIMAKAEGKDPVAAVERASKPSTLAGRVRVGIKKRKADNHVRVLEHEAKLKAVRAPRPLPALPEIMEPPLPERAPGDLPNIVALVYAFRAFQQFSSAHARRNLGNSDEEYYHGLKDRLRKSLAELGVDHMFDWSDFGLESGRVSKRPK